MAKRLLSTRTTTLPRGHEKQPRRERDTKSHRTINGTERTDYCPGNKLYGWRASRFLKALHSNEDYTREKTLPASGTSASQLESGKGRQKQAWVGTGRHTESQRSHSPIKHRPYRGHVSTLPGALDTIIGTKRTINGTERPS